MKWHLVDQRTQWDILVKVHRTKSHHLRRVKIAEALKFVLSAKGFDFNQPWHCFENNKGDLLYLQEDIPGELRD